MEALLDDDVDELAVHERLVAHAPPGLEIIQALVLDPSHPKPQVTSMTYTIDVPPELASNVREQIDDLLAQEEVAVQRKGRDQTINLRTALHRLELDGGQLVFQLRATGKAQAGPRDVLAALGLDHLEQLGAVLRRSDVLLAENA